LLLVVVASVVVAALWGLGAWRRAVVLVRPPAGSVRVGVVQANIDQARKWEPAFQNEAVGRHVDLTLETRQEGARLVVWPETAAPFYFQSEPRQRQQLLDLAASAGVDLLFGSPAYEEDGAAVRLLNRAYLVRRDGTVGGAYDKLRLVPFGEYVPLQPLLFFVDKMVEGVGAFAAGRDATVFALPEGRFGVLICYEGIFPGLSRALVAGGANFLVNITNDAWFGRTSAPHQHLAMVTLRAVENRVPVIRAANTGVSAVIDVDGSIRWQTGLFEEAARVDVVGWPEIDTVYTRWGDVWAAACAFASALAIGYGGLRYREDPR
jgi:apolipoprotein N-acyltransferase